MGYVVLRTDTDLSNQFKYDNTIYEVRYNFDLQGKTIEIPTNCILKFVGGKFMNGTMSGFTTIDAESNKIIFDNVTLTSNVYNPIIEADWFGEIGEGVDSSIAINKAIQVATTGNIIMLPKRTFHVANPIIINKSVTIDGRNVKNRVGGFKIIPTAEISVFVIGDGFLDGNLKNISITLASSTDTLARKYVGIEMTGCESFVVENVKVQYADIAYKLVTATQISLPKFDQISAHDCNIGCKIDVTGKGWANGIYIKPYWFTQNYVHFHISTGHVTTIQGGNVEIGYGTHPSWFGSSPRGFIVENDAVVNIDGCIWGENVNGTFIEAKNFAKINIYGDAWILENTRMLDYSNIKYYGSKWYPTLSYNEHSPEVGTLPLHYISAKNATFDKDKYYFNFIDVIGKGAMPNWNGRILRMSDGTPYISTVNVGTKAETSYLTNFTIAVKFVKVKSSSKISFLLEGGWSGSKFYVTDGSKSGHLAVAESDSKFINAFVTRNDRRDYTNNYNECVAIMSFDYDNLRVITMDVNNDFSVRDVAFLEGVKFDPNNYIFSTQSDDGTVGAYITDIVVFDSILSSGDFIWWMDFLKKGGIESVSAGDKKPESAKVGHVFYDSVVGKVQLKTAETFSSSTMTSSTWADIGSVATASEE